MNAAPIMDAADTLLELVADAEDRAAVAWLADVDPALAALVAGFPRWLERAAQVLERHPTPRRETAFHEAIRCWLFALHEITAAFVDEARP